jgi:hypothetical protein
VCLIVRDEAHNLPAALASVRGVAQELIVVDTGSRDGSAALAQALGARVLHFAWCDDFARARNVALEAARGDWLLCLDADQRSTRPACRLEWALQREDCLAQTVSIELLAAAPDARANPLHDGRALAVLQSFRSCACCGATRIRFQGRVHEDVADSLLALGSSHWPASGVRLCDHGYVEAAERERKRAQPGPLQQVHAESPEAVFPAYKLALSLPPQQRAERAALLEGAAARDGAAAGQWSSWPFLPSLLARTVEAWADQGRLAEAAQQARALHAVLGPVLDHPTGCALARAGEFEAARALLARHLDAPAPSDGGLWQADPQASVADTCWWLAWIARQQGEYASARHHVARGLAQATPAQRAALQASGGGPAGPVRMGGRGPGHRRHGGRPRGTAQRPGERLRVSARLAELTGDPQTALSLAQAALRPGQDAAAAVLATVEIQAGLADEPRLRQHHQALAGQFFDTLALKLLIARELGLPWPRNCRRPPWR